MIIQLEPASTELKIPSEELGDLLTQAMVGCIDNQEYFAIDLGGWDAPDKPYCLWALTPQDDQVYSIIETLPRPEGSEFWTQTGLNDAGTYTMGSIAKKETLDMVPYLMIDTVRTWNMFPWDLTLTFYS